MNIRIRSYFKRKAGKLVAVKGYTRGLSTKAAKKALGKASKTAKGKKKDGPLTYREWLSEIEGGKQAKKKKLKKETKGGEPVVKYTKPQSRPKTGRA